MYHAIRPSSARPGNTPHGNKGHCKSKNNYYQKRIKPNTLKRPGEGTNSALQAGMNIAKEKGIC